jgi:hypothetical protein
MLVVTGDETWVFLYDLRQSSLEYNLTLALLKHEYFGPVVHVTVYGPG